MGNLEIGKSSRKKTSKLVNMAVLVAALNLGAPPYVQAADNTSQPPLPGVKFTKVQDLDPNKQGPNRPIRQKFAVVIGISKFKEGRLISNDPVLDSSAKQFYDYLIDPHGGRFSANHVRLITNAKATKQTILSSIGQPWLGALAKPDDLAVVFITTNSFATTDGGSYLCAYDCALDNIYGTCISMNDLMDTIRQNVKAERILLILQAANSGSATLSEGEKARPRNVDPSKLVTGSGFIIISSSEPNQMSWSNIFSTNLIESLKLNDGMISLSEAFDKTKEKTEAETESGRQTAKQTPVLKADWKGKDLIIGAKAVEENADIPANVSEFLAAESYYFKANDLVTQGKLDEALVQYQKAIETDPSYADALADMGAVLSLKKDPQKAAESYLKAITEKPNDALYRANYARVLLQLNRAEESRVQLNKAYQLNPKDKVVLTALASLSLKEKNPQGAMKYLNEGLVLYPKSSDLFDKLSFAYAQEGNVAEAVDSARKAVDLDPQSLSARLNLGSTLLLSGDVNQATKAYIEATKLHPQDANARYLLANILEKTGDNQGAKEELQLFIKLADPADPRRKQAESKLSSM